MLRYWAEAKQCQATKGTSWREKDLSCSISSEIKTLARAGSTAKRKTNWAGAGLVFNLHYIGFQLKLKSYKSKNIKYFDKVSL